MKIPESVRIAGVEYAVREVENLNDGTRMAYGHIDYESSEIVLSSTTNMDHQKKCITLLHEIFHGIIQNSGIDVKNEEAVVDVFARGVYQVLQDNGKRLFDLKGD